MLVFSGEGHLVKNVTMYCFLSKTIQLINVREINKLNIARMSKNVANFWLENRRAAPISRFFVLLL